MLIVIRSGLYEMSQLSNSIFCFSVISYHSDVLICPIYLTSKYACKQCDGWQHL